MFALNSHTVSHMDTITHSERLIFHTDTIAPPETRAPHHPQPLTRPQARYTQRILSPGWGGGGDCAGGGGEENEAPGGLKQEGKGKEELLIHRNLRK